MPDLRESTNHLLPLSLPAQISLYFPGREGRLGWEDSPELPVIRAERRRLRDWLSTNIPIQWGKRVRKVEHDDNGVAVVFEDGTRAEGDILVGADGIKSVVREHLLQRSSAELLKLVPLAAIVGEVDLSGEAFKRQLALGHSAYIFVSPDIGFWNFGGLHHAYPDGRSGRHYWMFMESDPHIADPEHWLQNATQEEKLDYVLKKVAKMPPKFREVFEATPASGIKKEPHIWRDLELEKVPAGRVILMGDAAHAMTPFRGEGGYHTFIDAMQLSKVLGKVDGKDIQVLKTAVAEYNAEMLERGVEAVRNSRTEQAAGKSEERKSKGVSPATLPKPLPEAEIVLG
ncbi:FAD/NAD(P)-binding domain-containing protein [Aspergillus sclerotiicarbonarius CBS 121057]|uniref:FAD/NAD(P)-binding domain-containing protein n=1 Tax=Aspergillus sclerotiicarbonarius (strain CBS 121057 / IBT 28362) TaxID=1448318 RepID=A0A319E6Y0_ASPSB|nr:FAD/NAD(P)-binding domain-containing protein [Aspergillus sclerotiicarbonarius CBS 121057]